MVIYSSEHYHFTDFEREEKEFSVPRFILINLEREEESLLYRTLLFNTYKVFSLCFLLFLSKI